MPNYSFRSSGMRRKQNFEIVFIFEKVLLPPRLLPFAFSPPRVFAFLSPSFFFFCLAFTRLPFGGKRFCNKFEDREFFWKEVRSQSYTVFSSFSGLFDWIALIWVWLERFHLPAQLSCQSCLGPLKLMMSQVVQGTWLNKGGYGWFRGQRVKTAYYRASHKFVPLLQFLQSKIPRCCLKSPTGEISQRTDVWTYG